MPHGDSCPFVFLNRTANQRSVCGSERRSNVAIRSFRRQAETERAQFASTRRRTRPLNSGAHDCSDQSPRVSFDPLRLRIGCEGFLRRRRCTLTASAQEARACQALWTVLCRTVQTAFLVHHQFGVSCHRSCCTGVANRYICADI